MYLLFTEATKVIFFCENVDFQMFYFLTTELTTESLTVLQRSIMKLNTAFCFTLSACLKLLCEKILKKKWRREIVTNRPLTHHQRYDVEHQNTEEGGFVFPRHFCSNRGQQQPRSFR